MERTIKLRLRKKHNEIILSNNLLKKWKPKLSFHKSRYELIVVSTELVLPWNKITLYKPVLLETTISIKCLRHCTQRSQHCFNSDLSGKDKSLKYKTVVSSTRRLQCCCDTSTKINISHKPLKAYPVRCLIAPVTLRHENRNMFL